MTLAPADRWDLGANVDVGTLMNRQTGAEIKRKAGGARIGYGFDTIQLSSGLEYRYDETEQLDGMWTDRTTWLFRSGAWATTTAACSSTWSVRCDSPHQRSQCSTSSTGFRFTGPCFRAG
jgi:hypothetical protein